MKHGITVEKGKCPCCRQPFEPEKPTVDLNTNVLCVGPWRVPLAPVDVEMLSVLIDAFPQSVTQEKFISRVWGHDASEYVRKNVHVRICMLRKKLRVVPLKIVQPAQEMYRLEFPLA